MSVQNDNGFKAYVTAEALGAYRCVRFDANGKLVYADDEEAPIGVTQEDAASGAHCNVKLITAPGTFKIMTDAAVTFAITTDTRGPLLFVNNDGKLNPAGTLPFFTALEAADGAGAIIECIPYQAPHA